MYKRLARIITRLDNPEDGFMMGICYKNHGYFEPDTCYEVVLCELSGDVKIKKVGKMAHPKTWYNDINSILKHEGKRYLLSEQEESNYEI